MKRILILTLMFFALVGAVAACPTSSATNTKDFFNEIPAINADLQNCPVTLPSNLKFLVGNGNIAVNIAMNDGSTTSFTVVVFGGQITAINQGASQNRFQVNTDENSASQVFASNDKTGTIVQLFNQKKITTKSKSPFTSVKLAIARVGLRLFGPKTGTNPSAPPPVTYLKPANCDDTWLPGHQGYAQNKEKWDSYSAQSDGVCQSMRTPGKCRFNVQLSTQGTPYYLCWYDN